MSLPALVLDANALDTKGFIHWLSSYRGEKILPLVAYVELGVLYAGRRQLDRFRATLQRAGVTIEWMRLEEADRAIEAAARAGDFADRARDFLIAAHAGAANRTLVTFNKKDFEHLPRVSTPLEIMHP